ncbi:restriction endonuclease subunit S [Alteromonas pelagimontana]|uniref:Restriction endonuclease subunit S n=1 Tax=Alteromonas pelagimontana TaxID=1858656 RepID=A0A6M4MHR7_9ALTE|nr:restriction endonuclease subunit S [Alteromonas pelagimontana]QJR82170.1 restriction endonuclease subunit S [Alteromonas pelagimontana]
MSVESIITENLDIWTSAIKTKSASGRGSSNKLELYGIKKLRELILELAVRGKLVSQEQSVEKNDSFLSRLTAKSLCTGSESKLIVPTGWAIFKIRDLVSKLGSGSTPRGGKSAYVESGIPFLRSQNVWNDGVKLDDVVYISDEVHEKMSKTKVFPGDILLNITGASLGRTTVFPDFLKEANVSQHVTIVRMCEPELTNWVHLVLMSPLIQKEIWDRQVGMAIEGLSKRTFETFEIPIPPLNEQARIVEKVRELMALCDQLESQTEASIEAHQTLVKSLLETLTNAKDTDELNESWQRISEHFDVLFTTEDSIDQLKHTILQLAVMGKLVKQDPNDEPASQLLERIAAEKEQLIKDKKIKKQKPLPSISDEEKPFDLPDGWEWVKFDHIAKNEKNALKAGPFGSALKKSFYVEDGYKIYGQEQVISGDENIGDYYINQEKFESLISCKVQPGDMLISLVGTIGKVLILSQEASQGIINPRLVKLSLHDDVSREYIRIVLGSRLIQEELFDKSHGSTMNVLNLGLLRQLVFPLPKVIEQKRIVTRVHELLALCDNLTCKFQALRKVKINISQAFVKQVK